jgi:hypothetical protein
MTEIPSDSKLGELSAKVDSLVLGYKVTALSILIILSLIDLIQNLTIGQLRISFENALPGKPLPSATNFVLNYEFQLIWISLLWPVLGILALTLPKKLPTSILIITCLPILMLLLIAFTWVALHIPLVMATTGMRS